MNFFKFLFFVILLSYSSLSQAQERRLLFYAVDGVALRVFEFARVNNLIPNLQGLMDPENGGTFRIGKSHPKGVTAAGWATHFYGTNSGHGWNYFDNKTPEETKSTKLPHLFTQILHSDPEARVALFGSSESGILERVLKLQDIKDNHPEEWKRYEYARFQNSDARVIAHSVEAIQSGMDTLSYVLDVDNLGHEFGSESVEYLKALMKKDFELGLLLRAVSKSPYTWDVVVVTDHGFESSEVPKGMDSDRSQRQHGDDPMKRHVMTDNSRLVFSIFNSPQGVTIDGSHDAKNTLENTLFLRTGRVANGFLQKPRKIRRLSRKISSRFGFVVDSIGNHPLSTVDLTQPRFKLPTNLSALKKRYSNYTSRSCQIIFSR